jgi:hypothetical protein
MAKRTFMTPGTGFTAQTTNTALTSSTYMGIQGGATTQVIDVLEFLISGLASSSTVADMLFSAATTAPTGATALTAPQHDFGMNQYISALSAPAVTYNTATTAGPQISAVTSTLALNLSLNLFGGILRWNAAPTQQVTLIGSGAPTGSFALYNFSGGLGTSGTAACHIIYEAY